MSTAFKMKKDNADVVNFVLTPADFVDGVWESDEYSIQNFDRASVTVNFIDFKVTDPSAVGSINITPELINVIAGEDEELGAPSQAQNGRDGRARKVRFVVGPTVINFVGDDEDIPGPNGASAVRVVKQNGDLGEALKMRLVDGEHGNTPANPWTEMTISVTGLLN